MSNAERQARFRAGHPGYNRKYNGHPTAAQKRRSKQAFAELVAKVEAELAAKAQADVVVTPVKALPLMLPAPVEDPMMAALKALAASLASAPAEALPFDQSAQGSSLKSAA
jgi:hypothetical protein